MLKSMVFILHNHRAVRKIVGYFSEIKLVMSLASSRSAGNLKPFWFQVNGDLQRKTTRNQKRKENGLIKMKRRCFIPSKHSHVCVKHFTEDSFKQNVVVTSLLGPFLTWKIFIIFQVVVVGRIHSITPSLLHSFISH